MSKPSRRAHRRVRHLQVVEAAFTVGWYATPADCEPAKKATHDNLIAMLGDRRKGGIEWRLFTDQDAHDLLDRLTGTDPPPGPEHMDHYRQLRAYLRQYGGWLVVASANAVRL